MEFAIYYWSDMNAVCIMAEGIEVPLLVQAHLNCGLLYHLIEESCELL